MEVDKRNVLPQTCSCNNTYYVYDDIMANLVSNCPKCGTKVYQVTCPRCQSGYSFPENINKIDVKTMEWKCTTCPQTNTIDLATLRPTTAYNSYEQMPLSPEKIAALKKSDRIRAYIIGGIIGILLLYVLTQLVPRTLRLLF